MLLIFFVGMWFIIGKPKAVRKEVEKEEKEEGREAEAAERQPPKGKPTGKGKRIGKYEPRMGKWEES